MNKRLDNGAFIVSQDELTLEFRRHIPSGAFSNFFAVDDKLFLISVWNDGSIYIKRRMREEVWQKERSLFLEKIEKLKSSLQVNRM